VPALLTDPIVHPYCARAHRYDLETAYVEDTEYGNVIKGWDGYMDRYTTPTRKVSADLIVVTPPTASSGGRRCRSA
jgi:hypothetical protein